MKYFFIGLGVLGVLKLLKGKKTVEVEPLFEQWKLLNRKLTGETEINYYLRFKRLNP